MVREGIVLGHVVSERGIEVDKVKIVIIERLPPPTNVKGIWSFLGNALPVSPKSPDPWRIYLPMRFLSILTMSAIKAFDTLKNALILAPIIQPPDWKLLFESMCDASCWYFLTFTEKSASARKYWCSTSPGVFKVSWVLGERRCNCLLNRLPLEDKR